MKAHYVGGDSRGSHGMPIMPAFIDTPITGLCCLPIVSCLVFSISSDGCFACPPVDIFAQSAWGVL
jgi:fructose 1,6-bisphosphate aldolase/phosphatase